MRHCCLVSVNPCMKWFSNSICKCRVERAKQYHNHVITLKLLLCVLQGWTRRISHKYSFVCSFEIKIIIQAVAGKLHKLQITSLASCQPVSNIPFVHFLAILISSWSCEVFSSSVWSIMEFLGTLRHKTVGVMQTLKIYLLQTKWKEITYHAAFCEENIGKLVHTTFKLIIWHNILILLALLQFFQGNDFLCVLNQAS